MASTHLRSWLLVAAAITVGAVFITWKLIKPSAPTHVLMATGAPGGAYTVYGKRYAEIFARDGVTLELRESKGSLENLTLLKSVDSEIEVAFLQTGVAVDAQREGLISLGSVFSEPLWVFYRGKETLDRIDQLRGKRLGVGAIGSGTRPVVQALLNVNGIDGTDTEYVNASPKDAAAMLQRSELDVMFMVSSPDSPLIMELLSAPDIRLMSMARADAYSRHLPALNRMTIPRGVINLTADIPPQPIETVAATATLVAVDSLHPAIAYLFVKAAKEVHGGGSVLHAHREFPSITKAQEFDVPDNVEELYKTGTPFLYRYLPFDMANLVLRLWVLLIPLGALFLSASNIIPKLLGAQIRWRITRIYQDARQLEWDITAAGHYSADTLRQFTERLAKLNARADRLKGPPGTAKGWYELRSHLELVQKRLDALQVAS